jgi:hypothetical protein
MILYRDWFDSKDVLDVLDTPCQISFTKMKGGRKKTKAKTNSGKATSKPAKRQSMAPLPAALER